MLTITPRCARTAAARTRASSCAAQQEDVKCQSANSNVMDAKSNAAGHNSNALLAGPSCSYSSDRGRDNQRKTWGKAEWTSCGEQIFVCNSFFVPFDPLLLQKSSYEVRGTSRRGVRRSQKPFWALRSSGSTEGATLLRSRSLELHRLLGTSRRASRGGEKGASARAAKRRSPSGSHRCRVARALAGSNDEKPFSRSRLWRVAAERTSASGGRFALRGTLRNRRPSGWRIAFARYVTPGSRGKCGRGNRPLHAHARTTTGCAVDSRRGLAR
jgi:hypothetical protein